jgi:hypothetical protein
MRIYVSGIVQHSVFSSGIHSTTLHIALSLKQLGHDVRILNILDNRATWYDDVRSLAAELPVVQKGDFIGPNANVDCIGGAIKADLLIDVVGCLEANERSAIAAKTVLFVRNPALHSEIEASIYPIAMMKRSYDGIVEIWSWDIYKQMDFQVLMILGRCPVRAMPLVWSSQILDTFIRENNTLPWYTVAKSEQGRSQPVTVRVAETNATSRSSCTIPMVIMREFREKNPDAVKELCIHNGTVMTERPYFKENVHAHTGQASFVGRNRIPEWTMMPRSVMLAHCRFTPFRWIYLDAAYMGIPMVHNSAMMRQFGAELDAYYYPNNEITAGAAAIKKLLGEMDSTFTETALQRTRSSIQGALNVSRNSGWANGVEAAMNLSAAPTNAAPTPVAITPFRLQFVGMWDQFQVSYNFFTLLLQAYCDAAGIGCKVVGCGADYKGSDIHLRIMGPFGCTEPIAGGIPTVFTTSENIPELPADICEKNNIKLQLGFNSKAHNGTDYIRLPLWMMSIDWFGADSDKLVNPRLIPLEYLTEAQVDGTRPEFCAFVVTNAGNAKRNAALDLFGQVGHVTSAGRYRNNYGDGLFAGLGGGGGEQKKVEWLRRFRFSIAYENSEGVGYVTEKLFHAKAAGTVPIYWGDATAAAEDFDANGYLVANGRTDEELVAEVRRLNSDSAAWTAMAARPLLTADKVQTVRERLAQVATRMLTLSSYEKKGGMVPALGKDIKPCAKETVRTNVGSYGRSY